MPRLPARLRAVPARLEAVRQRSPLTDHVARAGLRYSEVRGTQLAAGITYYGFLAVFPLLALTLPSPTCSAVCCPTSGTG